MKTRRIVILVILVAAALGLLCIGAFLLRRSGGTVSVEKDRQVLAVIPFSQERWFGLDEQGQLVELPVSIGETGADQTASESEPSDQGTSDADAKPNPELVLKALAEEQGLTHVFTVSSQGVQMRYAACPDQICIHQGLQNRSGSSVVCLPYRLVLQVNGADDADPTDAVTN